MSARTAGPWTFARPLSVTGATRIDAPDGNPIAWVSGADVGRDRAQGVINAAFIVRACNAHEGLVAEKTRLRKALLALVSVSEIVQADCDSSRGFDAVNEWAPFFGAIKSASAALAKGGE